MPGSPQEWVDFAESDLRIASLAGGDPAIRHEQICFHAQQAAEKAIKGALLSHQIEFPLTHDLEQLLHLAEQAGLVLPDAVREAGSLTPYAVETRYPGLSGEITEEEVAEALQVADSVLRWAKAMIKPNQGRKA